MTPRIESLLSMTLVGMHLPMSLGNNRTSELWRSFMPHRIEIANKVDSRLISMQVYNGPAGHPFAMETPFVKWAAVQVRNLTNVPQGMNAYELVGGLYAVFTHHGPASKAFSTFRTIFVDWLPGSGWKLDDREHFEWLPEGYRPDDEAAFEEIWIPICRSDGHE